MKFGPKAKKRLCIALALILIGSIFALGIGLPCTTVTHQPKNFPTLIIFYAPTIAVLTVACG